MLAVVNFLVFNLLLMGICINPRVGFVTECMLAMHLLLKHLLCRTLSDADKDGFRSQCQTFTGNMVRNTDDVSAGNWQLPSPPCFYQSSLKVNASSLLNTITRSSHVSNAMEVSMQTRFLFNCKQMDLHDCVRSTDATHIPIERVEYQL